MAAHTMSRVMAGSRMSMVSAQQTVKQVSNGAKYFMKRKNSYMVEVNVAETETEDQAVRRYMRAVVQSGVINKLRALRTKETKIETYKRKLAERAQARKIPAATTEGRGLKDPCSHYGQGSSLMHNCSSTGLSAEFYGENVEEAKPFDEFFTKGNEDDEDLFLTPGFNGELPIIDDGYYNGQMYDLSQYDNNANAMYNQGGYIDNNQGESLEDYQKQSKIVCQSCQLSPEHLGAVRRQLQALSSDAWLKLVDEGVIAADVSKTLNAVMRYGSVVQACSAAALYAWLLRTPNVPMHNMLDTLSFSGFLQRVKETIFAVPGSRTKGNSKRGNASQSQCQTQANDADMDADDADANSDEDAATQASQPKGGKKGAAIAATDPDVAMCLCFEALCNMAIAMQQTQLKSCHEVLQAGLEGCTELLSCSKVAKVPAGHNSQGLVAGSISAAAYALLEAMFSPRHGSMQEMAAVLLPRLTPLMTGTSAAAPGKRSAAEAGASRAAAAAFVQGAYSWSPEIQDAVAALARHACLKAQDKADSRAATIKSCSELVTVLPQWEQEQFVGFVYKLSRSSKIGLRTLAVGLANNLVMNLPEPFKRSTFAGADAAASRRQLATETAATTGAADCGVTGAAAMPAPVSSRKKAAALPIGMTLAPWSVIALAAMLHRCSDKSAVVRGRALADLAEVVECFGQLLAQDPVTEQHQVAEAFLEGVEAAAALQVHQLAATKQQASKRRPAPRGSAGSDTEEDVDAVDCSPPTAKTQADSGLVAEEDAEEDPAAVGQECRHPPPRMQWQPQAEISAYIPEHLTGDLAPVMSLVHRRCGDGKAAVRRGALQLLEQLLIMRANWQGRPRQLPAPTDLALLEAATADPLVSVRKAALVALGTLLELFPSEPSLAQAWVSSGLPLVRDVEASIQDCLRDWAAALLFNKATAAAASSKVSSKAAVSVASTQQGDADSMDWQAEQVGLPGSSSSIPADVAFAELRVLLSAVASVGRAAGACLGKLCAAMAAKNKLKAVAVARGLQAVISGTVAGSPAALGAWMLLKEVAAQDPAAPSWQFLQQRWTTVRATAAAPPPPRAAPGAAAAAGQDYSSDHPGLADEAAALLLVISHTAAGFPASQAEALAAELLQHILSFQLPPVAAGAHVAALFKLTEAASAATHGEGTSTVSATPAQWTKQVFNAGHEILRRYIDTNCSAAAGVGTATPALEHSACVAVFTMGEVALLKAAKPPSGLTVLLQSLTAHKFIVSSTAMFTASQSQMPGGLLSSGSQLYGSGTQADNLLSQYYAGPGSTQQPAAVQSQTQSGAGDGERSVANQPVATCVQAHAWIALGKLCLVDEALAKKCVPLFVQELGRSPSPMVRNNIMVGLSDMVIQYTALVDAHMPRLAACIRDRHELVRRQALALLANLLMKDYVKWRGPLFHRFLLALVDPSPAVRQLAEYLLKDVMAVKAPLLAYNHFVEALFVLNGCTAGLHGARLGENLGHAGPAGSTLGLVAAGSAADEDETGASPGHGQVPGEDQAASGASVLSAPAQFVLRGRHNRRHRDLIYSALLRSMSPEHKFSSAAKLCGEVLAGVADGLLPLSECEEVLRDALCLMASKDIKVSASKLAAHDDDDPASKGSAATAAGVGGGGGSATAAEAAASARGKLVSALMKRHLVEQVVPVLVELRRLLAEAKHPLMNELMSCFASLLKEYKGEVEDILVADKQVSLAGLLPMQLVSAAKRQQQFSETALQKL
eukprot:gene11092-11246_t